MRKNLFCAIQYKGCLCHDAILLVGENIMPGKSKVIVRYREYWKTGAVKIGILNPARYSTQKTSTILQRHSHLAQSQGTGLSCDDEVVNLHKRANRGNCAMLINDIKSMKRIQGGILVLAWRMCRKIGKGLSSKTNQAGSCESFLQLSYILSKWIIRVPGWSQTSIRKKFVGQQVETGATVVNYVTKKKCYLIPYVFVNHNHPGGLTC